MASIITAHDLNLWYGDFKALKGISLDVGEREITALIGPSGCGKSTFLKTLNRMNDLVPNVRIEGDVRLRGEDIFSKEMQLTDLRRRVGMVFQTPNILPASIRQNMLLPLQLATAFPASEWRERMERSLTEVGLWHDVSSRLREPASILSGGQQQRLCLARTLALEPEILLLDEPTASLDPATTHTIENLLLKLASAIPSFSSHMGCRKPKNGLADCPVWERRLQGMLSTRRTPQRSRNEPFFDAGTLEIVKRKTYSSPLSHRMESALPLVPRFSNLWPPRSKKRAPQRLRVSSLLVSIPLPLVYPLAQKRLSGFFGAFTRTFGLIAQAARINCGAGQLTGMSDEPSFQLIRIDLWMELQCQHMIAHAECLVRGHGGEASSSAPSGRSNVSPCQCRTGR